VGDINKIIIHNDQSNRVLVEIDREREMDRIEVYITVIILFLFSHSRMPTKIINYNWYQWEYNREIEVS
jgi:hypothetical protein